MKRWMAHMLGNVGLCIPELLIVRILEQQELLSNGRMQTAQIVFAPIGPCIAAPPHCLGVVRVKGLNDSVEFDFWVQRQVKSPKASENDAELFFYRHRLLGRGRGLDWFAM